MTHIQYNGIMVNLNKNLTISFVGHRKFREIEDIDKIKEDLENLLESLILNYNAKIFRFGSKSEFNVLCHKVVSKLKERYPQIYRINHTCGEFVVESKEEKEFYENALKNLHHQSYIEDYEKIIFTERVQKAGKASYVARNCEMIDLSDVCIFYYNKNYKLEPRSHEYKRNSGTANAYNYAKQKKKIIFNLYKNL